MHPWSSLPTTDFRTVAETENRANTVDLVTDALLVSQDKERKPLICPVLYPHTLPLLPWRVLRWIGRELKLLLTMPG